MVGKQWISEMRNMRSEYYRKDFSGEDGCDRIEAEKKRKEGGSMRTDAEIMQIIDEAIRSIWVNEIRNDYENRRLLKEDTLKNALYYHLRNRIGWLCDECDLRIFTEFTDDKFRGTGRIPDMVIARMDMKKDVRYWGDAVTECLAVIEIKYKANAGASRDIFADYDKLRYFVEKLNVESKLYMATIWECEDDPTTWERKNAAWAKGKVTELNASFKRGTWDMQFYVAEH